MKGVRYEQRYWEDVAEGEALPPVTLPIQYRRVVMNAAVTRDFFAGHHDPEYARTQGLPTIYVSNLFFQSFVDRVVADWGGPGTFIARRAITNRRPLFAGDVAHGEATVLRRWRERTDSRTRSLVEISFAVRNQSGDICGDGTVVAELPGREET